MLGCFLLLQLELPGQLGWSRLELVRLEAAQELGLAVRWTLAALGPGVFRLA